MVLNQKSLRRILSGQCIMHRVQKGQRKYYKQCIAEARDHVTNNVPHNEHHFVAIGDYCQNSVQAGESYYYTPSSVYTFGLVNAAHNYNGRLHGVDDHNHMHVHVYEECICGKGASNMASQILRGLGQKGMDILHKADPGGKLTIFLTIVLVKIITIVN
jgi:hypothetical protein